MDVLRFGLSDKLQGDANVAGPLAAQRLEYSSHGGRKGVLHGGE